MNSLALNQALAALCVHSRAELLGIFGQYKYVGVSIGGVTIKCRKFLNGGMVNAIPDVLPFTYDFFQDNTIGTVSFVDRFAEFLARMQADGLNVSRVTSDERSFQVKAHNWRDPELIQARGEQFSKLLFIPCICHMLRGMEMWKLDKRLARSSSLTQRMIKPELIRRL
jgi:hypothetical protein